MEKFSIIDADSHIEEVSESSRSVVAIATTVSSDPWPVRSGCLTGLAAWTTTIMRIPATRAAATCRKSGRRNKEGRVFFTCEAEETSLPQVLELVGKDQMMASADIPHGEARERSMDIVRERADLWERAKRKILGENAVRFYNL